MNRFLIALLLSVSSISANAFTITVPTGLNPGDSYRLAFLTSVTAIATSTNIADYNGFVAAVANDVPELALLGTTWTVIGSTAALDARDNTGTNPNNATGAPIYLLNDTKLADSNLDLWDGTIDTAFNVNEFGNTVAPVNMWTGTSPDGTENVGFALGTVSAIYGNSSITAGWIFQGQAATSAERPLYAISGNLTVAQVPVPAAVWLFGSAIGLLGWMRRKAT